MNRGSQVLTKSTVESVHPELETFDFRNKWELVRPHLNHPRVQKALLKGMARFCQIQRESLLKAGYHSSEIKSVKFIPSNGPWSYTPDKRWSILARSHVELAIDRGEFKCRCSNPDDLNPEERAEYDKFEARFFPQPGTFQWYQCYHACHWIAPWLKELGKRVFPQWCWTILSGHRHSVAVAMDADNQIRMIFDILFFHELSAIETLEFVNQRVPGSEPLLPEAKFNWRKLGASIAELTGEEPPQDTQWLRSLPRFRLITRSSLRIAAN